MLNHNYLAKPLIDYLREAYTEEVQSPPADPNDALESFLTWASNHFKNNQPVNVSHLPKGIGVKLQNGQQVCFHEDQVKEDGCMRDEAVRITPAPRSPNSGVMHTGSYNI